MSLTHSQPRLAVSDPGPGGGRVRRSGPGPTCCRRTPGPVPAGRGISAARQSRRRRFGSWAVYVSNGCNRSITKDCKMSSWVGRMPRNLQVRMMSGYKRFLPGSSPLLFQSISPSPSSSPLLNPGRAPLRPLLSVKSSPTARTMSTKNEVEARIRQYAEEACNVKELEGFEGKQIKSGAVIGAGTMGGGIAMCLAEKHIQVRLIDKDASMLQNCFERMKTYWNSSLSKGKITREEWENRLKCVDLSNTVEACKDVDIVIEAVFEDMKVKKEIFKQIDQVVADDTILASNTSTLNIDHIFSDVSRPHNTVGLHFFSPAQVMPLLEVIRGENSSKQTLSTAMKLGKTLGKSPVLAGNCFGFIGNRMFESYTKEALFLLEEGALPHEVSAFLPPLCDLDLLGTRQVDEAIQEWGMVMGPSGHWIPHPQGTGAGRSWHSPCSVRSSSSTEKGVECLIRSGRYAGTIADKLVLSGRKGQKTQGGFYDYSQGRNPVRDTSVEEMIGKVSQELGIPRRKIQKEEIVERCILSLVNEGYKILDEGMARSWTDIDVVYAYGYGARNQQPMTYAKELGTKKVLERIRKFQRQLPDVPHWKPAQGILDALRDEDQLRAQQQKKSWNHHNRSNRETRDSRRMKTVRKKGATEPL
eukprot:766176-Hanusia_phi.AAC.3